MRLLCFPHAGGLAASFFDLQKRLGPRVEVCCIEYPGHGSNWHEPTPGTLDALVQTLFDSIRARLEGTYALLGHSFGAHVAFELAMRLSHCPEVTSPQRLFVCGAKHPGAPSTERIHELDDARFLEKVLEYDGVPDELRSNAEVLALLLPSLRSDFRMYESRQARSASFAVGIPITAFGGLDDPKVTPADVMAWRSYTRKSFRCKFFAGKHFFLFDPAFPLDDICRDLTSVKPNVIASACA